MTTRKLRAFLLAITGCLFILAGCDDDPTGPVAANAGADQEVLIGDSVTLDGNSSTGVDGSTWTFVSTPSGSAASLANSGSLSPTFTADVAGDYVVQLSINNAISSDTVTVTAKKVLAAITAGGSITTRERFGSTEYVINLEQSGGVLSGGSSRGSVTTYQWEQITGPNSTAEGATNGADLTFTAPGLLEIQKIGSSDDPGHPKYVPDEFKWQPLPIGVKDTVLTFRLTVTDADGNTDTAIFLVNVADEGAIIYQTSGLPSVGLGTVVVLSGPSRKAMSNAPGYVDVVDWSWTLTPPSGSSAVFADSGGTTSTVQFPKFTPDVDGLYTVAYTSTTGGSGTLRISASTYVGVGTIAGASPMNPQCGTCHDGGAVDDLLTPWSGTNHAQEFSDSYVNYLGMAPEPAAWPFHTVGYNASASNGGFDDLVSSTGFDLESAPATFDLFAASFPTLANVSGVQCENCHGPGAAHSGDPLRTAQSFSQYGTCGQCHMQESQWVNSAHNSTGIAHGAGGYQSSWLNAGCARCHTSKGFATFVEEGHEGLATVVETGAFVGITCAGCHNPHDATNSAQLRVVGEVAMAIDNGATVVNAGKAAVCYTCHDGLYQAHEDDCDVNRDEVVNSSDDSTDPLDDPPVVNAICTTAAHGADYYRRQVHYNPQGAVLEGMGAMTDLNKDGTDDFTLTENSFHSTSGFILASVTGDPTLPTENNKCVTCHMAQAPGIEEEGYNHLGGHSFAVRSGHSIGHLSGEETGEDGTGETAAGDLELTSACTPCHLTLTTFNRTARADYDGDGSTEGIQDEVKGLLLLVSNEIKAEDVARVNQSATASGTNIIDGEIVPNSIGWAGNSSAQWVNFNDTSNLVRRATWNHNMIVREASLGVHNAAFDIQVLQGTYKGLTGVPVPGATIR